MKSPRPHIPLSVRAEVAERQLGACLLSGKLAERLAWALKQLFGGELFHLDHDPPLAARRKVFDRAGAFVDYDPPANSAPHLIYRTVETHRVKTYVRGEHGQLSDRMLINRAKRAERGPSARPKAAIRGLSFQQQRCRMGARCSCSKRERKRCANFQKKGPRSPGG